MGNFSKAQANLKKAILVGDRECPQLFETLMAGDAKEQPRQHTHCSKGGMRTITFHYHSMLRANFSCPPAGRSEHHFGLDIKVIRII
jgi:hypothetical protein